MVCDKHAEQWRKKKQTQKKKEEADKQATERKDAKRKRALQKLSHTGVALLNSIVIHGNRLFRDIDDAAASQLKRNPAVLRVPSFRIVRQVLTMLVEREYLTHHLGKNSYYDIYEPEQQLTKDWIEIHEERKSATH